MAVNPETVRIAMDRAQAIADDLREIGVEELNRRNDLTAGRIATDADKLEAVVYLLAQEVAK